jgi:hypothetical protein
LRHIHDGRRPANFAIEHARDAQILFDDDHDPMLRLRPQTNSLRTSIGQTLSPIELPRRGVGSSVPR